MKTRRILRWCFSLVVMVAVCTGGYAYVHHEASERVKVEMLRVVGDMAVPDASRDEIRQRLTQGHSRAFNSALTVTPWRGRQFDHEAYFKQVFDEVIAGYRAEGRADVADIIDSERQAFAFTVTEQ